MLVKIQEASEILSRDGELAAIRFASRLKCLGQYRDPVQRAWAAHTNPDFYRGLGEDPTKIVAEGVSALRQLISEG